MRVVILGGGYTAVWTYRAVRRRLGAAAEITVVAPDEAHVFHGFTGEVLSGGMAPGLLASPLRECLPRARRIVGRATAVDVARRTVQVERDGRTTVLPYDELVVATGAHDRTPDVPGLGRHGWGLRSAGSAEALLGHLAALERRAPASEEDRARRDTVVVVGAGFAGVEAAAALGRRYGAARRVVLVSGSGTVVPVWRDRPLLQSRLAQNLADAGVEVLVGARVAEVDARGVRLADGGRIESATVVAALGSRAQRLPGLERFQEEGGLIAVDRTLRVTDHVWAAGDVAAVHNAAGPAPKDALWAIKAGSLLGRNIARSARGARPRAFAFRGLGTVAAFAPGRAVLTMWGIAFPQGLGWVVRVGFFLWYVPSRRTAARILVAALRSGRRAVPAVVPPVPALVGLAGGATPADRVRATGQGDDRRAKGA